MRTAGGSKEDMAESREALEREFAEASAALMQASARYGEVASVAIAEEAAGVPRSAELAARIEAATAEGRAAHAKVNAARERLASAAGSGT